MNILKEKLNENPKITIFLIYLLPFLICNLPLSITGTVLCVKNLNTCIQINNETVTSTNKLNYWCIVGSAAMMGYSLLILPFTCFYPKAFYLFIINNYIVLFKIELI